LGSTKFTNITLYGDIGELDVKGTKIAFVHSPKVAKALASTGDYEAVFYGHTHEKSIEKVGESLVINPGEIMGRLNPPSFCLYDTEKKDAKHIELI
jgi:putative phosphoesterase